MIPYKSIYDLEDLTDFEEKYALNNADIEKLRWEEFQSSVNKNLDPDSRWELWRTIEKLPRTKNEYFRATTQRDRYLHLFHIFVMRGNFPIAKIYEELSKWDYVRALECLPYDIITTEEVEYYKWRKSMNKIKD